MRRPVLIADGKADGRGGKPPIHKVKAHQIHHFLDDKFSIFKIVGTGENLSAGQTVDFGMVGFDILYGYGFPSVGVVN